jgi:hypothetical protein
MVVLWCDYCDSECFCRRETLEALLLLTGVFPVGYSQSRDQTHRELVDRALQFNECS